MASNSKPQSVGNSWRQLHSSSSGKKKKRSYNSCWEDEYPWVHFDKADMTMKCMWCVKTCQQNSFVTGSANFQKSALVRHEKTDHHKAATTDMRIEEGALTVKNAQEKSLHELFGHTGAAPALVAGHVSETKHSTPLSAQTVSSEDREGTAGHMTPSVSDHKHSRHLSDKVTSHMTHPVADGRLSSYLSQTPSSKGDAPHMTTSSSTDKEQYRHRLKTSPKSPSGGENAVHKIDEDHHRRLVRTTPSEEHVSGGTSHMTDSLAVDVMLEGGFLQGHVLQRWQRVALEQALKSDGEVAAFLLDMYEVPPMSAARTVASDSSHLCSSCQTPLTLVCLTCNPAQAKCETVSFHQPPLSQCHKTQKDSRNAVTREDKEGLLSAVGLRATRSAEKKWSVVTPEMTKSVQMSMARTRSSKVRQSVVEERNMFPDEGDDECGEDNETEERRDNETGDRRDDAMEARPFKCSVCAKAFKSRAHRQRHEITHNGEKTHKCDVCPAAFHNSHNLKVHYRKHTGERPFFCQVCQKAFARSGALKRHKLTHSAGAPFKCEWCGDLFRDQTRLLSHCCKEHKLERPYRCNQCEATFVQKRHLNSHLLKHSNPRPFLCDECGASFKHKVVLTAHKRIHKGIRPFTCDECGQSFYRQENLRGHQKTHTNIRNYVCTVCGAAFLRNNTLKRHMQSKHTNIRPFQCSECGKTFKFKFDLKNHHLSVHSMDKPYTCDVCGQLFSLLGNMRKHRKRLHPHAPPLVSSSQRSEVPNPIQFVQA